MATELKTLHNFVNEFNKAFGGTKSFRPGTQFFCTFNVHQFNLVRFHELMQAHGVAFQPGFENGVTNLSEDGSIEYYIEKEDEDGDVQMGVVCLGTSDMTFDG